MIYKILVINPGSTSTKIAIYENEKEIWRHSQEFEFQELLAYDKVFQQLDLRYKRIMDAIKDYGFDLEELSAIVGRGGILPPVKAGAYLVNEDMIEYLRDKAIQEHASNLGAALAYKIGQPLNIPSYIYDSVTVDEMIDLVKITGLKDIKRLGKGHNLNMRAVAIKYANDNNLNYKDLNIIVAHIGGGTTFSLHEKGQIVDMISDEDGAFSPERSGALPVYSLVKYIFANNYIEGEILNKLQRRSGIMDHLGTSDMRKVEDMIEGGDKYALLVYEAMALSISKNIAKLSVVPKGKIDAIILTGGLANSRKFTSLIKNRVSFIGKVIITPGEKELESLALGTLRVLRKEEICNTFVIDIKD